MRSTQRFALIILAAGLLATTGCGGKRVKVEGVVTLDGKPVEGATVQFVPVETGQPAAGFTDKNGVFVLGSLRSGDGALRGSYKVIVGKSELSSTEPNQQPAPPAKGPEEMYRAAGSTPAHKSVLPGVYGDLHTTPLTCEVPPDGPVRLELQSSGQP